MSGAAMFFIGTTVGLSGGFTIATLLLRKQIGAKITYEIDKLRAKKGGVIDVNQDNSGSEPQINKEKGRKKLSRRKTKN